MRRGGFVGGQHEEAIIVRHGGVIERIDTIDLGFPLGLEADIAKFVRPVSVALHPGDGVVLSPWHYGGRGYAPQAVWHRSPVYGPRRSTGPGPHGTFRRR